MSFEIACDEESEGLSVGTILKRTNAQRVS